MRRKYNRKVARIIAGSILLGSLLFINACGFIDSKNAQETKQEQVEIETYHEDGKEMPGFLLTEYDFSVDYGMSNVCKNIYRYELIKTRGQLLKLFDNNESLLGQVLGNKYDNDFFKNKQLAVSYREAEESDYILYVNTLQYDDTAEQQYAYYDAMEHGETGIPSVKQYILISEVDTNIKKVETVKVDIETADLVAKGTQMSGYMIEGDDLQNFELAITYQDTYTSLIDSCERLKCFFNNDSQLVKSVMGDRYSEQFFETQNLVLTYLITGGENAGIEYISTRQYDNVVMQQYAQYGDVPLQDGDLQKRAYLIVSEVDKGVEKVHVVKVDK